MTVSGLHDFSVSRKSLNLNFLSDFTLKEVDCSSEEEAS